MPGYPAAIEVDQVQPVARRVRGVLAGQVVFDTVRAVYVWELPYYPQYYVPLADVAPGCLGGAGPLQRLKRGSARPHDLVVGEVVRPGAARVYGDDALDGVRQTVRFDWDALDAWFEEDEEVFVHPKNPYARIDVLRSTRHLRVEVKGQILAESASPVLLFETGLPTRYYLNRSEVHFKHLEPSSTQTACPYKGRTSCYWSVRVDGTVHADLAWSYDFPTREALPIAGLVAFYNEKVDLTLDGVRLERPQTHFSD